MNGPKILARSLSTAAIEDDFGNRWQYHSRSDRHSKIACWCILFDLLQESALLRKHFKEGSIAFGINHELRDFKTNKKKNLDIVLCSPAGAWLPLTFSDLVKRYSINLDSPERSVLATLPVARRAPVGMVRMALEAKACMTAHVKAIPRLFDELRSSYEAIHGAASNAVAVGFVMVNVSSTFISPGENKRPHALAQPKVNKHTQPHAAERVVKMLSDFPRRTKPADEGFDGLAIVGIESRNDGSTVSLWDAPPAPQPGDVFEYDAMVRRVADAYESRYR